jgi:MoxR-like ATPase
VSFEDVRQMLPFVLHDKLVQRADSPVFEQAESMVYRVDRISWIRNLFDRSCKEYERLALEHHDAVGDLQAEFAAGLDGLPQKEVQKRLAKIESTLRDLGRGRKLYGHLFDDLLELKYLHQRYTNYSRWLKWKG